MFKIGQKVVCIDHIGTTNIIKDKIYIINGFSPCSCGEDHLILKGVQDISNLTICTASHELHKNTCFWQRRFSPIISGSAIKDLCNDFKEIKEISDVPIKELI